MIKQLATILTTTLAISACGSKPAATTTPTETPHEGSAMGSGTAMGSGSATPDPMKPTDPPMPDQAKIKADAHAAELAAYEKAKPVFAKDCANCHTKAGKKATQKKLDHFTMDTYPFGGEHTNSIGNEVRKVLGIDGGKATMPFDKPGSVTGGDLATIKAWTEAWQASGAAGNHPAEPADKDND